MWLAVAVEVALAAWAGGRQQPAEQPDPARQPWLERQPPLPTGDAAQPTGGDADDPLAVLGPDYVGAEGATRIVHVPLSKGSVSSSRFSGGGAGGGNATAQRQPAPASANAPAAGSAAAAAAGAPASEPAAGQAAQNATASPPGACSQVRCMLGWDCSCWSGAGRLCLPAAWCMSAWCMYALPLATLPFHQRELPTCPPWLLQLLGIKKVALMFLTTRRLAHEKLWRLWLWDAASLLPLQALPALQVRLCGCAAHACSAGWWCNASAGRSRPAAAQKCRWRCMWAVCVWSCPLLEALLLTATSGAPGEMVCMAGWLQAFECAGLPCLSSRQAGAH